jgi:DNA invertase Pin-like site-specific DNA recombinase
MGQGKKLEAEDQRRIIRMVEAARPKTEIARVVGVARYTVYRVIHQKQRLEPVTPTCKPN